MYLSLSLAAEATADDAIRPIPTPIERQVVLLALHDGRDSVCRDGGIRRLLDRLLGARRSNLSADPRLEVLRRFCVGRPSGCGKATSAQVGADCVRSGLTLEALCAAAMLSGLTRPASG